MRTLTVGVRESAGRILCSTVFREDRRKWLAKGHVISEEDARMLDIEGISELWVIEIEEEEVGEDEAVMQLASEIGCGTLEIRPSAGGRANLFAIEPCCVLVDEDLLKQVNCTASMAIATARNFSPARTGCRMATVKSAPFAVAKPELEAVISLVKARGPILQARPIRVPSVAVLYTDPESGEHARQLFEDIMRQRLDRFGATVDFVLSSVEEEGAVAGCLQHLLRAKPTVVLIASTTAPAGPEDVVGCAMTRAGCQVERFLAPVEPGNLFLLSYKDDVPVVSAPGCFRSAKPNVVDLVLPPMLARYRVSGWEVACLGHGGLLA